MKKLILNHKSYLLYDEILNYKKELSKIKTDKVDIVLFPSIQYLSMFNDTKYNVGTQNFHSFTQGSFSGEVNLESLKDMNINYTLVGEYSRIYLLGETKQIIKEKLFKSINNKFYTLLCIGEYKNSKKSFYSIKKEINSYLRTIEKSKLKYLSIVYEPKYTMIDINIKNIKETINKIKSYIRNKYHINIDVYYGGLVKDEYVNELFSISDGIVLGKKSTDINEVKSIIDNLQNY